MPKIRHYQTRSSSKPDQPSTSKPDQDRSEVKTPETADHTAKTPEPERPPSPDNCAICLSGVQNKSFTDSCLHTFCYVCLLEWSKVKAVCPLCKQPFKKIIYNVRSLDDFDEYVIPPPPPPRDHLWENFNSSNYGMRFRYRTTLTQDRLLMYQSRHHRTSHYGRSVGAPMSRPVSREEARRRRLQQAAQNRRRIYDYDMWVQPVSPTSLLDPDYDSRYRETSPAFYTENEACRYGLIPWLSRELNILLNGHEDNIHFVLELVLDLIQRFEIRSEEFYELVNPLVGRHARHFIHEFYHFARSPYDLHTYDQRATYQNRPEIPAGTNNESEDDDVMVVEDDEAPNTLTEMVSRSSGVPLSNMGPINVEWNISSTLGDVRTFLQNVMGTSTGYGQVSSGAAQMARIQSHHNYAGHRSGASSVDNEPIDLSAAAAPAVNIDVDSDDDVIFVRYEKAYVERSPIVLSSGSDEENVERERGRRSSSSRVRHRRHGDQDQRRPKSGSRSRSNDRIRNEKSRTDRNEENRTTRGSRSMSREKRSRSYGKRSRSHEKRSRSQDRHSRSRDDRSKSRNYISRSYYNSRSRSTDQRHTSERSATDRPRSRSRDGSRSRTTHVRHRHEESRESRKRHSSTDSVEITRVKRKKAKKHKRNKKHKKHHKRRRLSPDREKSKEEEDEPGTSGEIRKYKKHPTGHKSSKRSSHEVHVPRRTVASVVVVPTLVPEPGLSSGFESGDFSGDSPIDVTNVSNDVTTVSNDVTTVSSDVSSSRNDVTSSKDDVTSGESKSRTVVLSETVTDMARTIVDQLVTTATTDVFSECEPSKPDPVSVSVHPPLDYVTDLALIDHAPSTLKHATEKLPSIFDEFLVKNGLVDFQEKNGLVDFQEKNGLTVAYEPLTPSRVELSTCPSVEPPTPSRVEPPTSPRVEPPAPSRVDYDSDCIMNADDDVVFEGECRCRARQKCDKCLHSTDSSSSDSESSDSSQPVKSPTYLPNTSLPDVSCFVTIGNRIGTLGDRSRSKAGRHGNHSRAPVEIHSDGGSTTIDVENSEPEIDVETVAEEKRCHGDTDTDAEETRSHGDTEKTRCHGDTDVEETMDDIDEDLSVLDRRGTTRVTRDTPGTTRDTPGTSRDTPVVDVESLDNIITEHYETMSNSSTSNDSTLNSTINHSPRSSTYRSDHVIDVDTENINQESRDHNDQSRDQSVLSSYPSLSSSPEVFTTLENCRRDSSSASEEIDILSTSPGGVDDLSTSPGGADVLSTSPGGADDLSTSPGGADDLSTSPGGADDLSTSPGGADDLSTSPGGADDLSTSPGGADDLSTSPGGADDLSTSPGGVEDLSTSPGGARDLSTRTSGLYSPNSPQFDIDIESLLEPTTSLNASSLVAMETETSADLVL